MTIWLTVALGLGFAALAYLVIRMRIELRQCMALVRTAVEVMPAAEHSDDSPRMDWPHEAAIQPGSPAPPPLRAMAHGVWTVVILVREAKQPGVLPEGDELGRLRSRYQLIVAVPDGHQARELPFGIGVVTLPGSLFDHMPLSAAAMIDPDGVVQGIGPAANSSELLAFVHEGEHHGFGPALVHSTVDSA